MSVRMSASGFITLPSLDRWPLLVVVLLDKVHDDADIDLQPDCSNRLRISMPPPENHPIDVTNQ